MNGLSSGISDPGFFYPSEQQVKCLQRLELSVRLRRGLSVVIGDPGTGKTTLCHKLIRRLRDDERLEVHFLPHARSSTPLEFLSTVASLFGMPLSFESLNSERHIKESLQEYLFQRGIREGRTVVLIVDEGQTMPAFCLEILRELLNFEANEFKLLQIAVFAEREFVEVIAARHNFADRINFYHLLKPLGFRETGAMVRALASRVENANHAPPEFSGLGVFAVYIRTRGNPGAINRLCRRALADLAARGRTRAGWFFVRSSSRGMASEDVPDGELQGRVG